jgi:site-specific DNA-methyltransferase (adenine-specific)
MPLPEPAFHDPKHHLKLYHADSLELLAALPESSVDLIFADPPLRCGKRRPRQRLSNGGITCHAGKMVSVHKGDWDKLPGAQGEPVRVRFDMVHEFNRAWLAACQRLLKPNASIWVSGTAHVIHSVGFAMQQLGFKLLNDISSVKPNPPPNLSCRYFTHATETIIWAAKNAKSRHTFNYKEMKLANHNKQMKSVWEIKPPETWEKKQGKHPTQKPVALLERILRASTNEGDVVLDPFAGGSTTLISALTLHRQAIGCELSAEFIALSLRRICSNLVHAIISVATLTISLDPQPISEDRSCSGRLPRRSPFTERSTHANLSAQLKLVQQTRQFHFVGRLNRQVIFSTEATSLDDARQKFQASGHQSSDAIFIIKTETEIYLA